MSDDSDDDESKVRARYEGAYQELKIQLHFFITSSSDRAERSTSSFARFTLKKEPRCQWNRRMVGPKLVGRFEEWKISCT